MSDAPAPRALAALLVSCALACAPDHTVLGRVYEVRTPAGFDGVTPLPLVILVHGYGTTARLQDYFFPLSASADEKRVLLALPNGTVDRVGKRFWNATEACCNFERLPVDDVAFFRALVDDVRARYPVREGHVFLVGHSNGAFMSLRLACDASERFAGVVAVAGSTFDDARRCGEGPPVPTLLLHGDQDTLVPIEGRPGLYPSARETGARFAQRNRCTGGWADGGRVDVLGDPAEETSRLVVEGCPSRGAVELWTHEGTGHLPFYDRRWAGRVLDWLEAQAR